MSFASGRFACALALVGLSVTAISAWGCSVIAGLEDHEPLPPDAGIPDECADVPKRDGGINSDSGMGTDGGMAPVGFPDSVTPYCTEGSSEVSCGVLSSEYAEQDGVVAGPGPAFVVDVDTAMDTTTGLVWWRTPIDAMDYESAAKRCKDLDASGSYRIPSRIELATILDFGSKADVLVDPTVFSGITLEHHWASSPYVSAGLPDERWLIDLCTHCDPQMVEHGYRVIGSYAGNSYPALCVKGPPYETGPFVDDTGIPDTVRDARTGLTWFTTYADTIGLSWEKALAYCSGYTKGGKSDWRLPNIKELLTLVDDYRCGDTALFQSFDVVGNTPPLYSSTPARFGGGAFVLQAQGGSVYESSETYFYAFCVRGPD